LGSEDSDDETDNLAFIALQEITTAADAESADPGEENLPEGPNTATRASRDGGANEITSGSNADDADAGTRGARRGASSRSVRGQYTAALLQNQN